MTLRNRATVLALTTVLAGAGHAGSVQAASEAVYYRQPESAQPFSEAVRAGDLLIVSGQIGKVAGATPEETFERSARQALDRIGQILGRHGSGFDDVVKCTVMLTDMKTWPAFNAVYASYFKPDRLPARSAFGVTSLAREAPLEVECWAYAPLAPAGR
uniref:Endoribonuclease L-PSP n=1 Tax=Caulobacter sp. (strain K31) TaxID=366602 RepID=B0T928_CAUSK